MKCSSTLRTATLLVILTSTWLTGSSPTVADETTLTGADSALAEYRDLVGKWRGVGQPRRGSTRGAWQEEIEWHFHFEEGQVSLECASQDSRWMKHAALQAADQAGEYKLQLKGEQSEEAPRPYQGKKSDDGSLVFMLKTPVSGSPDRIIVRLVAGGDRLVVLYETLGNGDRYSRLAEVGYTRHGANFAQESYPECIVTGGRGTIPVEHHGKTYYVCCSGCRELFLESPDEIIAEYQRKKQEAGKPESK